MGARTPSTLRPRRGALKCEFCGRSLANPEALQSHQKTLHASALKRKERVKLAFRKLSKPLADKSKSKLEASRARKAIKKVVVSKFLRTAKKSRTEKNGVQNSATTSNSSLRTTSTSVEVQKPVKNSVVSISKVSKVKKFAKPLDTDVKTRMSASKMNKEQNRSAEKPKKERITDFKCPKCDKEFTMNFTARKHIQKYHCENKDGVPVPPDSPDVIQPIQIELCPLCDIKYTGEHKCPLAQKKHKPSEDSAAVAGCIACHKTFDRPSAFPQHVTSLHNDGLESLLFPTIEEFDKWRHDMETQTKTVYVPSAVKTNCRHYYQCSTPLSQQSSGSFSCPSLIIYQEYPKGIQVHFYKYHFEHKYKPYCMEDAYKNYSIADLVNTEPVFLKIKKEEPEEIESEGESFADEDLYVKFKTLMENIILDTAKVNMETLKVLANKALEMNTIVDEYNENEDGSSMCSLSSPKSDCNSNKRKLESITSPIRKKLRTALIKAVSHKSPILQRVKNNTFTLANDKDSDRILHELNSKEQKSHSLKKDGTSTPTQTKLLNFNNDGSPSSFNESYQNFISSVLPKGERKQKIVVREDDAEESKRNNKRGTTAKIKTKMGQYNPNSPKKNSPKKSKPPKVYTAKGGPKSKRTKVVRDFKYEIKERDDDCNILILKI